RHLQANPHSESQFFFPVAASDWRDPECDEWVAGDAAQIRLRDQQIAIPSAHDLRELGIVLEEPPRLKVFELCRFLAEVERDLVLATEEERRRKVPEDLVEVLILDGWKHPDVLGGELPSSSEAFRQLALVLASGDASAYRPTEAPNTHWRFWPEGGRL
ncbi:MAG: hypothetical protein AAGM22_32350, partial [Acidobacteriota bacterium]